MDHSEVLRSYQSQKENTPPELNIFQKFKHHFQRTMLALHKHPRRYIKYGIIAFIVMMILIPVVTYILVVQDIYDKERLMSRNDVGITLLDRNDKPFFAFYQPKSKTLVTLPLIPKPAQQAVIAVEDKDFYNHSGFSLRGIGRAIFTDASKGSLSQGGSTITQQLVKNLLLNSQRSPIRKYQEIVLAIEIDRVYKKDDILEMYLNSVYFGEGAFGMENAAQTYFGKKTKDLSLAESALLAGLLPAPSAYSPLSNDPKFSKERQAIVLSEMVKQNYISEAQRTQALNQSLKFAPKKEETLNQNAPLFALMVKDELKQKYGSEDTLAHSGMVVKTTLDLDWQKYAETVVLNQVNNLKRNKVNNGAAVAIDPKSGQIRVMVGSKDWADETVGKFNIATANRQPGSAMKPIVYGAALEQKIITPATILDDKLTDFGGGYKPKNYDGRYRGPVTVRKALSNSLNVPAVKVLQQLGVEAAVSKAKQMGLNTLNDPSQYGLALVLGAGEVRLLDLTNAYGVFASYGRLQTPTTIIEVKDKNGKSIYQSKEDSKGVLQPEAAFLISAILSDDAARAEVFGGALTTSHHAAVKTGTTDSYKDAWTVGYTPSLVIGSWVGNNDATPMDTVAGAMGAAPIWRQLMEKFLAGTPVEQFRPVGSIVEVETCVAGAQPSPGSSPAVPTQTRFKEYFIYGTQPEACPTPAPTPTPTPSPSASPTEQPTPTPAPTQQPTPLSTPTPIATPTLIPSPSVNTLPVVP